MGRIKSCVIGGLASVVVAYPTLVVGGEAADQNSANYWRQQGTTALEHALRQAPNTNRAKNVILFVGDGNGISSVTATRIFDGQSRGESGEENVLSFEGFPHVALAKTYNTNQQTPDSAGTMTAMVTGVKTLAGVLSLGPEVSRGDCKDAGEHSLPTILEQARQRGLATGIVSTTRITHATPGATYAHGPERDWEDDSNIPDGMKSCTADIARQLVESGTIDVALGGGRRHFLPQEENDPEYPAKAGERQDGRNLLQEWRANNPGGQFVWNEDQFKGVGADFSGPLLGLFEPSHMAYEADRIAENAREPSLAAMTEKALALLKNRDKGFFLMVESGRIDHAHHAGNAYRALVEGQMLAEAVAVATARTDPSETLIIVTADHSHVLTMAGYPTRGNPILGKVVVNDDRGKPMGKPYLAEDGRPFTTLSYGNGPGYGHHESEAARYGGGVNAGRHLTADDDTTGKHFHQESLVPLYSETHGGEDVAIYARGPWAHLIHGVQEQSYIYYVMKHALGF